MADHTGRLIATIILGIFAIISLLNGYVVGTLFWALIAFAVGYPFVRGGKLNLQYENPPAKVMMVPQ